MDVNLSYYGNQFMMYVSQMSMLYTLNLYSDVCQLFLNKTGKKNLKPMKEMFFMRFFMFFYTLLCMKKKPGLPQPSCYCSEDEGDTWRGESQENKGSQARALTE